MALALLDGTSAAIDLQVALTGSTPNKSMKCFAGTFDIDLQRGSFDTTTFCTTGWAGTRPTTKKGFILAGGFASSGNPLSDPSAMFTLQNPIPFLATVDTGCTISGSFVETRDRTTLAAAAASGRLMAFETDGPLVFVWVTA